MKHFKMIVICIFLTMLLSLDLLSSDDDAELEKAYNIFFTEGATPFDEIKKNFEALTQEQMYKYLGGDTLLGLAIYRCDLDAIEYFLYEKKFDVNVLKGGGNSLAMLTARSYYLLPQIFDLQDRRDKQKRLLGIFEFVIANTTNKNLELFYGWTVRDYVDYLISFYEAESRFLSTLSKNLDKKGFFSEGNTIKNVSFFSSLRNDDDIKNLVASFFRVYSEKNVEILFPDRGVSVVVFDDWAVKDFFDHCVQVNKEKRSFFLKVSKMLAKKKFPSNHNLPDVFDFFYCIQRDDIDSIRKKMRNRFGYYSNLHYIVSGPSFVSGYSFFKSYSILEYAEYFESKASIEYFKTIAPFYDIYSSEMLEKNK